MKTCKLRNRDRVLPDQMTENFLRQVAANDGMAHSKDLTNCHRYARQIAVGRQWVVCDGKRGRYATWYITEIGRQALARLDWLDNQPAYHGVHLRDGVSGPLGVGGTKPTPRETAAHA